jgi:hypothetical protein
MAVFFEGAASFGKEFKLILVGKNKALGVDIKVAVFFIILFTNCKRYN